MRCDTLTHVFVEHIPDEIKDGVLYVSIEYATLAHKCCCGCGSEVVTPLSPTDWTLMFHGDSISLDPSIGNWSLPCESHYWISRNRVLWARRWTMKEIDRGRERDRAAETRYYKEDDQASDWRPRHSREPMWRKFLRRMQIGKRGRP